MISLLVKNYTKEDLDHLGEMLLRGFMDNPCDKQCDKCTHKRPCLDILDAYKYIQEEKKSKC